MAVTDKEKGARGGISRLPGRPGTRPASTSCARIPMIGGAVDLRGRPGGLPGRRAGSCWARRARASRPCRCGSAPGGSRWPPGRIGMAQRALDMMLEYAPQRVTFGVPLSDRQAIQWWVADAATQHPRRPADDLRLRLEAGPGPRRAHRDLDDQGLRHRDGLGGRSTTPCRRFGAMGMTKELPLQLDGLQAADHADL